MAADLWAFLNQPRVEPRKRPVSERLRDWRVVIEPAEPDTIKEQSARCMDCAIPFCHNACPLGNAIPDWNALANRDAWKAAIDALHATNNFPEFTGWLCPAPCEASCVLSLGGADDAVTIKQIELSIIDHAFAAGWVQPRRPAVTTGHSVAVIGSGPAGLAAAQQLARAGHAVTVFERDARPGGLLRYGIPDFKMDKELLDRRLEQLVAEGIEFRTGVAVGYDLPGDELLVDFDAVVLACGALAPRDLDVPGHRLEGVHQALPYLTEANRVQSGELDVPSIDAAGKRVVIIGGGDTGADCLGTANRQGAVIVHQLDHNPCPPASRDLLTNPWPQWPRIQRKSSAHEEGVAAEWSAEIAEIVDDGNGRVAAIRGHRVERIDDPAAPGGRRFERIADSAFEIECDLVLLAMGFVGTEPGAFLHELGVDMGPSGQLAPVDDAWQTSAPRVFACGDMTRGASLVVWAIAEGRSCAAAVDRMLTGRDELPEPVTPGLRIG